NDSAPERFARFPLHKAFDPVPIKHQHQDHKTDDHQPEGNAYPLYHRLHLRPLRGSYCEGLSHYEREQGRRQALGTCERRTLSVSCALLVPRAYCRVFPGLEDGGEAGSGCPSCTLRRVCTALTPLTCWAICMARCASAALATPPVNATTPCADSTLIPLPLTSLSL